MDCRPYTKFYREVFVSMKLLGILHKPAKIEVCLLAIECARVCYFPQ